MNAGLIIVVVILLVLLLAPLWRESIVSLNTTAGGPDSVLYQGVLASGPDRLMQMPSRPVVAMGNSWVYL